MLQLEKITARELIRKSATKIGVLAVGENLTEEEYNDGFSTLNQLVDKWNIENLMVVSNKTISTETSSGKFLYTLSNDVDLIPDFLFRPVQIIHDVYLKDENNNIVYTLKMIDQSYYESLNFKNNSNFNGISGYFYYKPSFPKAELYVYPAPDKKYTLSINVRDNFTYFDSLDSLVYLPPAYTQALIYNLCIHLCMDYNKTPKEEYFAIVKDIKNGINANNSTNNLEILRGNENLNNMLSRGGSGGYYAGRGAIFNG